MSTSMKDVIYDHRRWYFLRLFTLKVTRPLSLPGHIRANVKSQNKGNQILITHLIKVDLEFETRFLVKVW